MKPTHAAPHRSITLPLVAALALSAGCSGGKTAPVEPAAPPAAAVRSEPPIPSPRVMMATEPAVSLEQERADTVEASPVPSAEEIRLAWREGVSLYEGSDYGAAADRLALAARGRPDHAYGQYLLGLACWKADRLECAEEALVRSTELSPGFTRSWVNLGRVRMKLDDPRGTLDAAGTVLDRDAAHADALHLKARALEALGRTDEALETARAAHAADPDNGYIANTLGWMLLRRDLPEEAVEPLELSRDRLPDVGYVRNNLGVAYERTGRLRDAASEYRAAIEGGDPAGKATTSLARIEPLLEGTVATAAEGDGTSDTMTEAVARHASPEEPDR